MKKPKVAANIQTSGIKIGHNIVKIGKGGACSSLAKGKKVKQPKPRKAGAFKERKIRKGTEFRRFYDRGDLPLQVAFEGAARKVQWKVNFDKLDYHHYLPIFFDGIREVGEPYQFLARQGTYDLLAKVQLMRGRSPVS